MRIEHFSLTQDKIAEALAKLKVARESNRKRFDEEKRHKPITNPEVRNRVTSDQQCKSTTCRRRKRTRDLAAIERI